MKAYPAPLGPQKMAAPLLPYSLAAGAALLHFVLVDSFFQLMTRFVTALLAGIAVLSWARYLQQRPSELPWLPVITSFMYLQQGMGALQAPVSIGVWGYLPQARSYDSATLIALVAELAAIAGFSAVRRIRKDKYVSIPDLSIDSLDLSANVHLAGGVLMFAFAYSKWAVSSFGLLLSIMFGAAAVVSTTMLVALRKPSRWATIRVVLACGLAMGLTFRSSMLGDAVFPLAAGGIIWVAERKRLPLAMGALVLCIGLVLQPVKTHFRIIKWAQKSEMSAADAWAEAFSRTALQQGGGSAERLDAGADEMGRRASEFGTLAYVYEMVPSHIPHGEGLSYAPAFLGVIPRAVWPDKPNMTTAGVDLLAIALGLSTQEQAMNSTTGVPLIHCGYFEHGVFGSIAWLFVVGLCVALVASLGRAESAGARVLQAVVLVHMTYALANTLAAFLGCIQQTVGLCVMLVLLRAVGRLRGIFSRRVLPASPVGKLPV